MELSRKSWFARKYLKLDDRITDPNTFCELMSLTLVNTISYLLTILFGLICAASLFITFYFRFDLTEIINVFGDWGLLIVIINALFAAYVLYNYVFIPLVEKWLDYRWVQRKLYLEEITEMREKLDEAVITRAEYNAWYQTSKYNKNAEKKTNRFIKMVEKPLDKVVEIIYNIYLSVYKKTCVIIKWK